MRTHFSFPIFAFTLACCATFQDARAEGAETTADAAFFEKKIRPLLAERCYSCHSADTKALGGLRVDDRNGLLSGGESGPAVIPGDSEKSLILQRVQHQNPKRRMPKEGDLLTEAEVADLSAWISGGAAWPAEKVPASLGRTRLWQTELKAKHWAWQALTDPAIPAVSNAAWPADGIDRFILAQLEAKNLSPVSDADAATLLRRITLDLTGLPPTPAEIDAFVGDRTADAYEGVVDRLLASRQFAERWARHWLDVARYGESTGPSRNIPYPHAWKYRDYVIDAVNRDVPYDRFIQEQVAGDLLPAENPVERDRLLTATGFLALGVKDVNQRFKVRFLMDNVDEQIDTVTRSTLGLTVSCARCHDHKFDPIPATDYYSLAGIFTSTQDGAGVRNKMGGGGLDYYDATALLRTSAEIPEPPADQVEKRKAEVAVAKEAWEKIRNTPEGRARDASGRPKQRAFRVRYDRSQAELLLLSDPGTRGYGIHGVRDAEKIADTELRIRGEAEKLGPVVPRGFLTTFEVPGAPDINREQSGRLELAQWLTSPKNPLASRVIVNRVWQHLFGEGIVKTVDNFGAKGDVPSHPELLDHLASRFIRDGWSIKKLVRAIVLSRAYRLGTDAPATHLESDPANRLVWRHSPRRLDAEEIRDAMLASANRLELSSAEASPVKELRMAEIRDDGVEARRIHEKGDRTLSRSLYLPLLRGVTPKTLEAFDPVHQTLVTGQRETTTVPTQALYLLNSAFVRKQSLALAAELLSDEERPEAERLREAYRRVLGRDAEEREVTRAAGFLAEYAATHGEVSGEAIVAQVSAEKSVENTETSEVAADNPDDIDRTPQTAKEDAVQPRSAREAAWMSFVQALYASAEFRFVR
ncbi:MAG: PSD1 and planctomycete cytochrome C domain-containing protein [Verrucomicrobiota bacterium]